MARCKNPAIRVKSQDGSDSGIDRNPGLKATMRKKVSDSDCLQASQTRVTHTEKVLVSSTCSRIALKAAPT